MFRIKIEKDGLLDASKLQAWTIRKQKQIRQGVLEGMKSGGGIINDRVKAIVASKLNIKRASLLKSFKAKVFSSDPNRLPDLLIGSKLKLFAAHQAGGTILPKKGKFLFVPFPGGKRPGKKGLQEKYGKTFLLPNRDGNYTVFQYKGKGGITSKPIGLLVKQVELTPRYNVPRIVRDNFGTLVLEVEEGIKNAGRSR